MLRYLSVFFGAEILLGSATALPVRAQRTPLDSLAAVALERNLGLRQLREADAQGVDGVRQARGLFLPSVSLESRYSKFSGVVNFGDFLNPAYAALNQLLGSSAFPTDINQTFPFAQETKLRTQLPLFNGGLFANLAAARALRDLRGAERLVAMRRLDAEVRIAYLNWARAEKAVAIWDAALVTLRENQRVAQRLVDAGSATPDAVLRARAATAESEQQRADAIRTRDSALGLLNLLLNRDLGETVPELQEADLPRAPALTRAGLESRVAAREELRLVSAQQDAAAAQLRAAAASFLPSVAVAVDYGVQGSKYQFDRAHDVAAASLVVSWNLFNGGQDAARRQSAAAGVRMGTLKRAEVERQLALELSTALDAVTASQVAREAATARRDAAERAFVLVDRRYGEGLASHLEWSDAQSQQTAARLNVLISTYTLAARIVEFERAAATRTFSPE